MGADFSKNYDFGKAEIIVLKPPKYITHPATYRFPFTPVTTRLRVSYKVYDTFVIQKPLTQ